MKRTYRLTALILVLLMLVNLSASATSTGISLDELNIDSYETMVAEASGDEASQESNPLSYPCEEKPEYCQFSVYSQMTATGIYDYFNKIYADENGDISELYAAMMLHYGEYHLESNLICTCGVHSLPLPDYQIGDISVHDEDCPWHFANLTVPEQYSVVMMLSAEKQDEYMGTLTADQTAALEEYINAQSAADACDGEGCGYKLIKSMTGAERHAQFGVWIETEADLGNMYNVFINHVYEKHPDASELCLCDNYQANYAQLYYGSFSHVNGKDANYQPVDCPWHFSQLSTEEKQAVFAALTTKERAQMKTQMADDDWNTCTLALSQQQVLELEAYLALQNSTDPADQEKLDRVNKTEYSVTSNGDSETDPSTTVAIKVPQGAFDVDYIMNAAASALNNAQQAALQAMHQLAVFDISFAELANEANKLQPNSGYPVELSFTVDTSKIIGSNLHVHHLKDNGDGTYTAESLGSFALDKSQQMQTVTVECPAFSSVSFSADCDGSACGYQTLLSQTAQVRYNTLVGWVNTAVDSAYGNYYVEFIQHLYDTHKPNDLICLCGDFHINYEAYTYGSINHMTNALDFHDQPVVCPWHFSQIPVADQAVILQDKTDEERAPYLATLNDEQRKALDEYMSSEVTLSTANGTISGKMPAGATAVMTSVDVNTALVNALVPASEFAEGTMTTKAYDIKLNDAEGNTWMPTEPVTVTVNGIVDESWEEPLVAVIHLLDSAEAIAKEQANGNLYTIDDAEILAAFPDELTAAQAAGLGNVLAFTYATSENNGVTMNANGDAAFLTNSFSTYYLVAGSQDGSGGDTFHILRGTSVELTGVANYTVAYPDGVTDANSGVVITHNNNTLTFSASEAAVYGTYVITVSNNRTATINIYDPQELFELTEDTNAGFRNDVYFTVITDSSTIPSEPVSGGNASWNYIQKGRNGNYTFNSRAWGETGLYQASPDGFLNLDVIAASDKLTQNIKGDNTIGVIDSGSGKDTLPCVALSAEEWHEILVQFVDSNTTVYISNGSGGTTQLTSAMVNEKLEDGSYRYQMYPYVVKLIIDGSSYQDGWHVDCCIVDTKTYYVSYEFNLSDSAIVEENSDLIKPDTKLYSPGTTGVSVGTMKLGRSDLYNGSSITIYDNVSMTTSEYTFKGWNTEPDGTGTAYTPNQTLPAINDNVTLYAVWEVKQTSAAVKIIKNEVFEDSEDARKGKTGPYVFTVTMAGAASGSTYPYESYNADGTKKASGSIANGGTVSLLNGEYVVINNVPAGTVTVSETASTDYVTSWVAGASTSTTNSISAQLAAASQLEFECTNTYALQNGSLTIKKTVVGTVEDGQRFLFKVTGPDGYTAELVLAAGESVTLDNLPFGDYTVTEETNWSVRYTVNQGTQTQTMNKENQNPSFKFVNTRKTNDQWLDANAGVRNEFTSDKEIPY